MALLTKHTNMDSDFPSPWFSQIYVHATGQVGWKPHKRLLVVGDVNLSI